MQLYIVYIGANLYLHHSNRIIHTMYSYKVYVKLHSVYTFIYSVCVHSVFCFVLEIKSLIIIITSIIKFMYNYIRHIEFQCITR